jgi:small nuclear ribonucleoprotein (snRNP)-like protein
VLIKNLFLAYFRSLIENECSVDVELKSSAVLTGKISFVDNNMCIYLHPDAQQISKLPPQFAGMTTGIYIRGSAIRAAYLPKIEADLEILSELCQKG